MKAVAVANLANELLLNCLDQDTSQVAGPAALRGRTPRRVTMRAPTPTSKVSFEQFGNKGSGSEQDNVLLIYFFKVQGGLNWSALKNESVLDYTLLWVWHLRD